MRDANICMHSAHIPLYAAVYYSFKILPFPSFASFRGKTNHPYLTPGAFVVGTYLRGGFKKTKSSALLP
jgi:hypothetical protein